MSIAGTCINDNHFTRGRVKWNLSYASSEQVSSSRCSSKKTSPPEVSFWFLVHASPDHLHQVDRRLEEPEARPFFPSLAKLDGDISKAQ